jgi:diguanylate cyclase (GGDEF)-like protein/PAS domain S-box-containing protein
MLETYADITGMLFSRINAEEETLEMKNKLENLANQSPGTIYQFQRYTDGSSRFPYASEGIYDVFEVRPEEVLEDASMAFERIHPDDYESVVKNIEKSAKTLKIWEDEYRVILPTKGEKWLKGKAKPEKQEDGSILWHGNIREITNEKELNSKIISQNKRLENIIDGTNVGTWERNLQTNKAIINEKWAEMLGYKLDELSNMNTKSWENLVYTPDLKKIKKEVDKLVNKKIKYYDIEYRMKHKNGKIIWVNGRGKISEWSKNKEPLVISGTTMDITNRKKTEEKIYNEREKFKTTLLSVGDGVISTDKKGNINVMNKIAEELTGWDKEDAQNKPLEKVLNIIKEETREKIENPAKQILKTGKTLETNSHVILINKDGKEIHIEKSASPIKNMNGNITGTVIVFRDCTEKREKQKKIEFLSFYDPLTGLYNRRYMSESIKRLDTYKSIPFSVIVADVNGLKLTNDSYGHDMGDKLLIEVAKILESSCRKEDIVCRVGGDEFVILLPNVNEKKAEEIIERIKKEAQDTKLDSIIVSLAIGYSTKNEEEKDILQVYKEADNEMYKNKLRYGKIMRNKTIEKILLNINNKYDHEQIHSERVSQYCLRIAEAMNLNNKDIENAKIAGILHDIGKIIVPPEILNKNGKLTESEWQIVKKHAITSYQLLKSVDEYAHLAEAVLHHHEKLDGTGYPEGLTEEEVPLLSKIIAVADAYEAMTAERSYGIVKTKEEAVEELRKYSGTQFNEKIVEIFVNKVL